MPELDFVKTAFSEERKFSFHAATDVLEAWFGM